MTSGFRPVRIHYTVLANCTLIKLTDKTCIYLQTVTDNSLGTIDLSVRSALTITLNVFVQLVLEHIHRCGMYNVF